MIIAIKLERTGWINPDVNDEHDELNDELGIIVMRDPTLDEMRAAIMESFKFKEENANSDIMTAFLYEVMSTCIKRGLTGYRTMEYFDNFEVYRTDCEAAGSLIDKYVMAEGKIYNFTYEMKATSLDDNDDYLGDEYVFQG